MQSPLQLPASYHRPPGRVVDGLLGRRRLDDLRQARAALRRGRPPRVVDAREHVEEVRGRLLDLVREGYGDPLLGLGGVVHGLGVEPAVERRVEAVAIRLARHGQELHVGHGRDVAHGEHLVDRPDVGPVVLAAEGLLARPERLRLPARLVRALEARQRHEVPHELLRVVGIHDDVLLELLRGLRVALRVVVREAPLPELVVQRRVGLLGRVEGVDGRLDLAFYEQLHAVPQEPLRLFGRLAQGRVVDLRGRRRLALLRLVLRRQLGDREAQQEEERLHGAPLRDARVEENRPAVRRSLPWPGFRVEALLPGLLAQV
mmetsp:Transcript_16578/g.49504  ORF Transcript_16578/g.49504 Transcript_16578/m.49504 type:complete len:317 (+) Transcript_16578:1-951(+)